MPLESAAGVWDLNSSNPPGSDQLAQTDDHLRLIKSALLATFPNINGVITPTDEVLNDLADRIFQYADGTVGAPSVQVGTTGTQGLYKSGTNKLGIAGRLTGDGAVPTGAAFMFPRVPAGLVSGGGAGGTYLELNGATYQTADYPDLASFYGSVGATFVVDDMYTLGRFPRSRSAATAVGATQASQNKAHTHTVSGTAAAGATGVTVGTSVASAGDHTHPLGGFHGDANGCCGLATSRIDSAGSTFESTKTAGAHTHTATSTVTDPQHSHTVSGTAATDGGTEARPESIAMIFAVKT